MGRDFNFREDGYVKCDTIPELKRFMVEAGFESLEDFELTTGVSIDEILGKWFLIIGESCGIARVFTD